MWWWIGLATALAQPLTLEVLLESLDGRQPKVAAALAAQDQAEGALLSARGAFDPVLTGQGKAKGLGYYSWLSAEGEARWSTGLWGADVSAGWRYGQGSFAVYDEDLYTLDAGELMASLEVPLLYGGPYDRQRADRDAAEAGVDAGDAGVGLATLLVEQQARISWWDWVGAVSTLELAQELAANADSRAAFVAEGVRVGSTRPIDQVEATRVQASRQAEVAEAEQQLATKAQKLSLYWRDEAGRPRVPTGADRAHLPEEVAPLDQLEPDEAAERVLSRRPDLRQLRAQVDAARVEARLAGVQMLPKLDAGVGLSQDIGQGDAVQLERYRPTELSGSLKLEVPLTLRRQQGKARKARAKVEELEAKLVWAEDALVAEVRAAQAALVATERAYLAAQQSADLALQLEQAERDRYDLGATDLFTVFLREQSRAEATRKAIKDRVALERARVLYEVLVR